MRKTSRHLVVSLFAWNDMIWALLACMMLVVALLITQIQTMKTDAKTEDDKSAGNISVYVFWRDGIDADIDTHLMGPNGEHVFYGRTAGHSWNLLRDDLGGAGDDEKRNFENAYSRGIPPGGANATIRPCTSISCRTHKAHLASLSNISMRISVPIPSQ